MSEYHPTTEQIRRGYIENAGEYGDLLEGWFDRWLASVERAAAEKAWDRCVGEMPIDPDWKNFYGDNNPYHAAALGLTAGQEGEISE